MQDSLDKPRIRDAREETPGLYTIGHGDRQHGELLDALMVARIDTVIDVRSHPGSRRFPRFDRSALARALDDAGIAYRWLGRDLGGQRRASRDADARHPALATRGLRAFALWMESERFDTATASLERDAHGAGIALLCAERDPLRCHRWLIADHLLAIRGVRVVHLGVDPNAVAQHRVTASARPVDGVLRYDRGTTERLDLEGAPE